MGKFSVQGFMVGLESMENQLHKTVRDLFDVEANPQFAFGMSGGYMGSYGPDALAMEPVPVVATGAAAMGNTNITQNIYAYNASEYELEQQARAQFDRARWGG